jgi:hypothetical protein
MSFLLMRNEPDVHRQAVSEPRHGGQGRTAVKRDAGEPEARRATKHAVTTAWLRQFFEWVLSDDFAHAHATYLIEQARARYQQRMKWEAEAAAVWGYTQSLPNQPWVDDPREQAAVRFYLSRRPLTPPRPARSPSRFRDPYEAFAEMFDHVRRNGDRFTARCPAHRDKSPSLSVARGHDNRVLMHCHAGCATDDVLAAIGWRLADLFPSS